jgi:hypothetical protein
MANSDRVHPLVTVINAASDHPRNLHVMTRSL